MKKILCALGIAVVAGFALLTGAALVSESRAETAAQKQSAASSLNWLDDNQQALALAKQENKPILINFTGSDWCPPCIMLKNNVFNTPEFEAFAKENLILEVADFPRGIPQSEDLRERNAALAQKYGIQFFPTLIILDSEGRRIGQMAYRGGGAKPFIAQLEKIIKK